MSLLGCSNGGTSAAGSGGSTSTTGSGGSTTSPPDAGIDAGPPVPTWTAFASRGADSRWGVPLAYSTKTKTFIGFGGSQDPNPGPGGTFSLAMDTGTWTKLTDTKAPLSSYCSCTTYLPDQDQVLLFSGLSDSGPLPAGASTLDLATGAWSSITGAQPGGGIGCAAVYMPAMGRAIVFGGLDATKGFVAETWSYDPAARTFTKLTTATAPTMRADTIATFDPGEGGRMLIFSGTSDEQTSKGHDNDLWAFDGTSWTEITPTGGPPPGRRVAAGGFDPVRRRWVVFGGTLETKDLGDLWVLDLGANTWTALPGDDAPKARGFSSAGYDPGTDSYFVVGGLQQPSDALVADGWKLTLK